MQFLDAIGLAHFWEKIKSWVGKNYLSLKGGTITGYVYFKGGAGILAKESDESVEVGLTSSSISAAVKGENGKLKETFTAEAATGNVLCGELTASKFVKTNGTTFQVLMADGSVRTLNAANGICGLDANGRIPLAQLGNLDTSLFKLVTSLPSSGESNKIYIVKDGSDANDVYQEYYYTNGAWEKIGTHTVKVDLTPYAKTADVNVALSKKVDVVSGKGLSTEDFTAALKTKLNGIATGATADSAIPISVIDALN